MILLKKKKYIYVNIKIYPVNTQKILIFIKYLIGASTPNSTTES